MDDKEKEIIDVESSDIIGPLNQPPRIEEPYFDPRVKSPKFAYGLFVAAVIILLLSTTIISYLGDWLFASLDEVSTAAYLNFTSYVLTFVLLVVFLLATKTLVPLAKEFGKVRPYLHGLFYGFIVIMTSVATTLLMQILFGETDENLNQQTIELILARHPVSSFFWIVLLGPLVEEVTYRAGLFNAISARNKIAAYVISALVFGFLHFNIPVNAEGAVDKALLIEEFINIPGYLVSGLVFGYIYDKEGFAGSSMAHITNNLLSYIMSIISIYGGK